MVELKDVTIRYGRKPILSHFTWTLRRGENWGLLGPNGSGKSTLLSLIQGDNPQAYAHQIRLFGLLPDSTRTLWEVRQRLGWVSPELHLHHPPEWRCLDVVCSGFFNTIGLYQACSRGQRVAAHRCLRNLGLGSVENLAFGELSFGQQRMVLLGRALVKRPRLLVLDEPCQGLDAAHRQTILEAVDQVVPRTGASLIFVTHHPREIPRCVTHILELRQGRLERQGPRKV